MFACHPRLLPCQIKEEEAEKERLQDLEYMRQQTAQLWVAGEGAVALGRWNSLAAGRRGCGWQGRGPGWEGGASLRQQAGQRETWADGRFASVALPWRRDKQERERQQLLEKVKAVQVRW